MSDQHDYGKTHRFTRDAHGGIVSNDYTRPECFALYYTFRHAVDDSNNLRQGSDSIEDAWQTEHWTHRTFGFILGVCEANAFNAYRFFSKSTQSMDHLTFRRILCEELLMGQRPAAKPSKRKSDSSTAPGGDLRLAGHEHLKFQKGKKW